MSLVETGEVIVIGDVKSFGKNNYEKREIVLAMEDGKYRQEVAFEFGGHSLLLVDRVDVGDTVSVHFSLRGREWKGRYFVSLAGYQIEIHEKTNIPALDKNEDGSELDIPF